MAITVLSGGGNLDNPTLDRTRPPLKWMAFEATSFGLRLNPFKRNLKGEELIKVNESLTWGWWPFEILPFKRLSYAKSKSHMDTTYL